MLRFIAMSLLGILIIGCGGGSKPTQEQLGKQLTELAAALDAGDLDKAVGHMQLPPGRSADEVKPMLPKLVERQEISVEGVKILLEKGEFGPLAEVFPKDGAKRAERAEVKLEECYALRFERAEVMAHWDGGQFKIFRLDDVGKITALAEQAPGEDKGVKVEAKPTEEAPPAAEPTPAPAEPTAAPAEPAPAPAEGEFVKGSVRAEPAADTPKSLKFFIGDFDARYTDSGERPDKLGDRHGGCSGKNYFEVDFQRKETGDWYVLDRLKHGSSWNINRSTRALPIADTGHTNWKDIRIKIWHNECNVGLLGEVGEASSGSWEGTVQDALILAQLKRPFKLDSYYDFTLELLLMTD